VWFGCKASKGSGSDPKTFKAGVKVCPANANREPESGKPSIVDETVMSFGVRPRCRAASSTSIHSSPTTS
jgi:hypothetical protein